MPAAAGSFALFSKYRVAKIKMVDLINERNTSESSADNSFANADLIVALYSEKDAEKENAKIQNASETVPTTKSASELGKAFESAYKLAKENNIGNDDPNHPLNSLDLRMDIINAFQSAYREGGRKKLMQLAQEINSPENISGPYGPVPKFYKDDNSKAVLYFLEQDLKEKDENGEPKERQIVRPVEFKLPEYKDTNVNAEPLASVPSLVKALKISEDFLQGNWQAGTDLQRQAIDLLDKLGGDINKLPKNIVDGIASNDVDVLNKFLEDHGSKNRFDQINGLGIVSSFSMEGSWTGTDVKQPIKSNGKEYSAFQLNTNQFFKVPNHNEPVVKIYDQNGIKVYVTPYEKDLPGMDASKIAEKLTPNNKSQKHPDNYAAIVLPNVDMDKSLDLNWLVGMKNESGESIGKARTNLLVQMDKEGFKAAEVLDLNVPRSLGPLKRFTMDKPMLFWAEFDNNNYPDYPIMAVKIDREYWKKPIRDK